MTGTGEAKPAAGGPDVESVRAELVRLGYLTSGVDRWFLDDVGSGRRPVRRALSGALRGALLVTSPVAVALAAVLATRNPSPLGRWFDGPVLVLHALVPAFAASFLLLAVAGLAATGLFLRAGRTPDPALLARGIAGLLAGLGAGAAVFATGGAPGGTGETIARDVGTVIVNCLQVEWITATADEASLFPEATVSAPCSMSTEKTGFLR